MKYGLGPVAASLREARVVHRATATTFLALLALVAGLRWQAQGDTALALQGRCCAALPAYGKKSTYM